MTTQQVAERYSQLTKENNYNGIYDELFALDAKNIEPPHVAAYGMQSVDGVDAIKKKGEVFNSQIVEMHGGYTSEPVVAGEYFTVAMGMDVTMKEAGRTKMDEIVVYHVKDGKIVSEEFFY